MEQFYTDMLRKQGLAPATARDRIQDLSLIAPFAIGHGFLRKDPTVDALKNLRAIAAPKIRLFKLEEVRAVMQALQMRPFRREERGRLLIRIYVHLAASCGMRLGEINGLRLDSINLDVGPKKIANSLTQFNELKGPKTKAGNREVALTKEL